MMQSTAGNSYQLLYFSPRPEDGEQVCVGVVLDQEGRFSIEFDEKLGKMRFLAREGDIDFVRSTLAIMESDLHSVSRADLSRFIARFEPQFRLSASREIVIPFNERIRKELRQRFLRRVYAPKRLQEKQHEEKIQQKLGQLIEEIVPPARNFLTGRVRAADLLGDELARELRIHRSVSQAVRGPTRAVLIDGVDTSVGTPTDVIGRANRIGFTFWQYGKVGGMGNLPTRVPRKIIRVGVVFDGLPKALELREYSLHQFRKDGDIAVASDSREGTADLRVAIDETIRDLTR